MYFYSFHIFFSVWLYSSFSCFLHTFESTTVLSELARCLPTPFSLLAQTGTPHFPISQDLVWSRGAGFWPIKWGQRHMCQLQARPRVPWDRPCSPHSLSCPGRWSGAGSCPYAPLYCTLSFSCKSKIPIGCDNFKSWLNTPQHYLSASSAIFQICEW